MADLGTGEGEEQVGFQAVTARDSTLMSSPEAVCVQRIANIGLARLMSSDWGVAGGEAVEFRLVPFPKALTHAWCAHYQKDRFVLGGQGPSLRKQRPDVTSLTLGNHVTDVDFLSLHVTHRIIAGMDQGNK